MPVFKYKARSPVGELITGDMEGESPKAIKMELANQGCYPLNVEAKGSSFNWEQFAFKGKASSARDLMALTRQFATLYKAGVAMDRLLAVLARQTTSKVIREALDEIKKDVSSGISVSRAFKKHPRCFDDLYVSLLNVGEQGGILDQTLAHLANLLAKEHQIKEKVKSATLYPKIVVTAYIGVFSLMMRYVVPKFADFYSSYGAELPLPTRILLTISNVFVDYGPWVLLAAVAAVIAFRKYIRTEKGGLWFDRLRFKTPVFGHLNLLVANARFGHLLGALYRSGVPLTRALPIVGKTINNKAFQVEIEAVTADVEKGTSLGAAMTGKKFLTPMVVEMVSSGEQSGSLDEMLEATAAFYDAEVSQMLDRLSVLIEPFLLIGIFAMVAALALAIFLPMWGISRVVLPASVK